MDLISKLIPDVIKLPVIAVLCFAVGAAAMYYPARWMGATNERQVLAAQSAKEALDRVQNLEKNNANFRNLSDRDRCLAFMRDSKLPISSCDER
ncbi:Hypothetical protein RG1141_CH01840 [Neorhizobium galegae bv. officinalis bv. officinalis str. HAMBI 1141]|uniref:Uncharacterized protein n=1 Tax=Neorhizobium galegae bv. officinalis bv. officinalis str. HAMBI 1141 TaxID=1028801 RepID=A0A068T367_NEOGA|nr:hypothetical protein [Neorhizobium galegae]CDN52549.1 Hypothetical protein RG1141_CH01840 [Neorhizobium galegae bv. officinalis bv. officinalis str. HAMBI 1141]